MKEIQLTQGKYAMVDDEDYEKLRQYKWGAIQKAGGLWYARRYVYCGVKKYKQIYMHREITSIAEGILIDHKDRNGLNNQKDNLRLCTVKQNCWNSRSRENSFSKYKGVSFRLEEWLKKRWRAAIEIDGKSKYLGDYLTEEEAAIAYDYAAIRHQREFVRLNMESIL